MPEFDPPGASAHATLQANAEMTARERVVSAARGAIPGCVAMPWILSTWSPLWFVVVWTASYAAVTLVFSYISLTRDVRSIQQWWSLGAAVVFALVPVSAAVFSGSTEDYWAATTVAMVFISFELAALPFLRMPDWRAGVLLVAAVTALGGAFIINPVVSIALVAIVLTMVQTADRVRQLKVELEQHLNESRESVRRDPLTGLLNRRGLGHQLDRLGETEITLVLIDVDRFKLINDSYGHQAGDVVLREVAHELDRRLRSVHQEVAVARLGGDEFVAVIPGEVAIDDSLATAHRIDLDVHEQAVSIDCSFSVGVSVGASGAERERRMSEAGFAMRRAKRFRGSMRVFEGELEAELARMIAVSGVAQGDLDAGSFVPEGQLIVEGDRFVGCELLIRWHTLSGEVLLPGQFLSLAADAGLMTLINETMLEHAVRFAARFEGDEDLPFVTVNISAPQLAEVGFVGKVLDLLTTYDVDPYRLMLEVTETEQLARHGSWEVAAHDLCALGVQLAIDDFGQGYSSIERLHQLPISHIKFDRNLVAAVDGPFSKILAGVVDFAEEAGIAVVAEGIETEAELSRMQRLGVSLFQGYYFHRPEPLDTVAERLEELRSQRLEELRSQRDAPRAA